MPKVYRNTLKLPEVIYKDILALWSSRIFLDLKGIRRRKNTILGISNETALEVVGAETNIGDIEDIPERELLKILEKRSKKLENKKVNIAEPLNSNLNQLADLVGLNQTEKEILAFSVLSSVAFTFEEVTDSLGQLSASGIITCLSIVLRKKPKKIAAALSSNALLAKTGLIRLKRKKTHAEDKLTVLENMSSILLEEHSDIEYALRHYFSLSQKPKLNPTDFHHIKTDFELLHGYLRKSDEKEISGLNILIHGKPGTGKTELARTLAASLERPLYEVSSINEGDEALEPKERIHAYQLSQVVLSRSGNALILFDEIEDVFPRNGLMEMFGIRANSNQQKAWLNRVLEENKTPTLWISNTISHIDEAFIRRFDYVLEVKEPPRSQRKEIIKHYTASVPVSSDWLTRIASSPHLAPGVVARAARVTASLEIDDQEKAESTLDRILSSSLTAMGYPAEIGIDIKDVMTYRPDLLNPDYDLQGLLKGLRVRHQGRLCLYGPPGTGKSAFGRHVADILEIPLLVKRASDLLDRHVGGTEIHLKQMFEEAEQENAVLLLDEADTFLQNRRSASQFWEISQVNELLTQMEKFNGIFICSTNLLETMDEAAMRRFDLKINFDFLKSNQIWILFNQVLRDLKCNLKNSNELKHQVMQLQKVTPGDFATVIRQTHWQDKPFGADELYKGLLREIKLKNQTNSRSIGFIANL